MAQVEGFEPLQDFHPLSVFKTDPFSRTWVNPHAAETILFNKEMVVPAGIEPATRGFSVLCSTD